jgi:hypothetical protein
MSFFARSLLQVCSLIPFSSRKPFILTSYIARVSRDGRDLVVLSRQHHVIFIRDFERICRGETTFKQAGLVLGIQPEAMCYDLGFEDGRVCVATVRISQTPLVISSYLCLFVASRALYFHLPPRYFGAGCVRATF